MGVAGAARGDLQSPVVVSRFPTNISSLLLLWIFASYFVNVAVHPASQNLPIDINELCVRPGMR